MKLLLFQRKLRWSSRTWQNGHSPISPSGSVVSGLSRSNRWMWGRMGRRRPWRDTDNPRSTAAWTSKTFWRRRLTLVSIPYFLLGQGDLSGSNFWRQMSLILPSRRRFPRYVCAWGRGVVMSCLSRMGGGAGGELITALSSLAWGNAVIPVCSVDMSLSTQAQPLKMCAQVIAKGSPWGSAGWEIRSELCMGRGAVIPLPEASSKKQGRAEAFHFSHPMFQKHRIVNCF